MKTAIIYEQETAEDLQPRILHKSWVTAINELSDTNLDIEHRQLPSYMQGTAPEAPVLASCSAPRGKVSKPLLLASPCQPAFHGRGTNISFRLLLKNLFNMQQSRTYEYWSKRRVLVHVSEANILSVRHKPFKYSKAWTCWMKHKRVLHTDFKNIHRKWYHADLYQTATGLSRNSRHLTLHHSKVQKHCVLV